MRAELRKIKGGDLLGLVERGCQSLVQDLTPELAGLLEQAPYAYTIELDGVVCMCGGVIEYWTGRAEAWAVIDTRVGVGFRFLHKLAKDFLEACPVRRIEAAVQTDFRKGRRWVEALGFVLEASCLRSFLPNGKDAALYAMVKHG